MRTCLLKTTITFSCSADDDWSLRQWILCKPKEWITCFSALVSNNSATSDYILDEHLASKDIEEWLAVNFNFDIWQAVPLKVFTKV